MLAFGLVNLSQIKRKQKNQRKKTHPSNCNIKNIQSLASEIVSFVFNIVSNFDCCNILNDIIIKNNGFVVPQSPFSTAVINSVEIIRVMIKGVFDEINPHLESVSNRNIIAFLHKIANLANRHEQKKKCTNSPPPNAKESKINKSLHKRSRHTNRKYALTMSKCRQRIK